MKIYLLIILCFIPYSANAQEDSLQLKQIGLRDIIGEYITPNFLPRSVDFKGVEFESLSLPPKAESIDMKLRSLSSIPPYYTNPSPMFYGDWKNRGMLLQHLVRTKKWIYHIRRF